MTRELIMQTDDLTPEVKWLNKMFGTSPETAVIQVTTLLGAVMLRRTDHTQWRETVVPAVGLVQGDICVDAANLANALKQLSGTIAITIGDERLVLSDSERTVKLRAATAFDYPNWPTFEANDDRTAIGAIQFARVLTSVGHDETLPQLSVVAFDKGAMVTTDRFRLTKIGYGAKGFVGQVPLAAMQAFAKADGVVWVESGAVNTPGFQSGGDDAWVRLVSNNRTVTAATADTTFPKWRQLIPAEASYGVSLRRDDLLKAVAGEETALTITGDEDTLLVTTTSGDDMEVEQKLRLDGVQAYDTANGSITVRLRSKYVKEALNAIGSPMVLLTATAPDKPVMFQDIAQNDLHLIMPVRQAV